MSIDDGHKRGPARDPDHDSLRAIQQETTRARRRGASCALHRPLLKKNKKKKVSTQASNTHTHRSRYTVYALAEGMGMAPTTESKSYPSPPTGNGKSGRTQGNKKKNSAEEAYRISIGQRHVHARCATWPFSRIPWSHRRSSAGAAAEPIPTATSVTARCSVT